MLGQFLLFLLFPFTTSFSTTSSTSEYFMSVANENEDTQDVMGAENYDLEVTDKKEDLDPVVASFIDWANQQQPLDPLSTWKPPLGTENITETSFGSISSSACPRGCYRSRNGLCLPNHNLKPGYQSKVSCYAKHNGVALTFPNSYSIIFLLLLINIIHMLIMPPIN